MRWFFFAACLLAGCARTEGDGPPRVRLGRDECRECGMIIAEERSAGALIVDRGGRRGAMLFDDIGCMLDAEEKADLGVVRRFAHDYATKAWTSADTAVFVLADGEKLPTPMGSGIAAFANREGALKAREHSGGETLGYAELRAARRAQMKARYGERKSP